MSKLIFVISISLLAILFATPFSQTVNNFPIVGIVTIPSERKWVGWRPRSWNYIAASYVKFIESAGAQVVPVPWDLPTDQLYTLLSQLNGVLFTGGNTRSGNDTNPAPVYIAFQNIINWVLETNRNGTYYPLWGTCLGFETIARVLANNISLLTRCAGCEYVNTNNYPVTTYKSRMLADLPQDLREKMTYANLSLMAHIYSLDVATFNENPALSGNLSIVAYAIDQNQTTYVSMYESRIYPIYAIQFHQEKAAFEWKPELDINHSFDAIRFEQYLGNFFGQETRKNNNTFPGNATALIYNYNTTVVPESNFNEVYFFPTYNRSNPTLHALQTDNISYSKILLLLLLLLLLFHL